MSSQRRQKHPIYRVNLKLDYELDEDLITWMEAQPRGALSQAIREALRRGLEVESQIDPGVPDYEYIRQIVANELARVLSRLHLQTHQGEDGPITSDAEAEFGARLDQMLGGLSDISDATGN